MGLWQCCDRPDDLEDEMGRFNLLFRPAFLRKHSSTSQFAGFVGQFVVDLLAVKGDELSIELVKYQVQKENLLVES